MKLTAEQYSQCWKDRVGKEEDALISAFEASQQKPSTPAPAQQQQDETRSVMSSATSYYTDLSSRVSSSSVSARKLEILQQQLEEERQKRVELETKLRKFQK